MALFYIALAENGWTNETSQPDEWISPDRLFEVNIAHTASMCTIRYRKLVTSVEGEATETYYRRRSLVSWSTLSRATGGTSADFRSWLGRAYQTIEVWCNANRVSATAPGEAP
jgi:hypothetical protein